MKKFNIISKTDVKDLSISNKQIKDNKNTFSASENHRHVLIGHSNVDKTDYMLKNFEQKR